MSEGATMPRKRRDRALIRRLERLARRREVVEAGRKLVVDGILEFKGFPDAQVDLLDDWTVDPFENRSWQWNSASFNFMPQVLAYHVASGDEAAMDFALRAVASWTDAFPKLTSNYEFADHDHAAALRAENSLLLLAHLHSTGRGAQVEGPVESLVRFEASRLAQEAFYSRHTNHGIEQSRVLALIANALPHADESEGWWELALGRLVQELEFAFCSDGVHVENSPGYHVFVCNAFTRVVSELPEARLGPLVRRLDILMPKAMVFLAHITRPDGLLPIIGDTQSVRPVNCFHRYSQRREYRHMLFSLSQGKEGEPPTRSAITFPESGYAVVRDRWSKGGDFTNTFQLIFKSGWRSSYHRHDDDLNITLYCGEDWLIDGGMHCYRESDPLRRYLRSKWAHNIPVVEPVDGNVDLGFSPRRRQEARLVELEIRPSVRLEASTTSYPGYRTRRTLEIQRTRRAFCVEDSLEPATPPGAPVRFRSLWHVPRDKQVFVKGGQVLVVSTVSGRALQISALDGVYDHVGVGTLPVDRPSGPKVSWHANKAEPCTLVVFESSAESFRSRLGFQLLDAVDTSGWTLQSSTAPP